MASRPERAYRIADSRHPIFDGNGAFLHGARWNSPGRRIIYASESFPGTMLEILVHARIGKIPRTHAWVEAVIPSDVSLEELDPAALPGWDSPGSRIARRFGDAWHEERRTLILVVPSVVTSGRGRNLLIHQDHPEFPGLRPSTPQPVEWDSRLFEH